MRASDVIALARRRINDPSSDGRYSTADMLDFLTAACDQLMRDILFPDCHVTFATVPYYQEYQLPELLEIHAVYIAGRLCPPAPSKDVLEGNALLYYDQSGQGSPLPIGQAGPSGNVGQYCPRWTITTPAAFPAANSFSDCVWPAPSGQPWMYGQRPQTYVEGGYLGIVPIPSSSPSVINGEIQDNVDIRCVLPHPDVTDIDQPLWFPKSCRSPLARYVVAECRFSEETQAAMQLGTMAMQQYTQEKNQRRTDANVYRNMRNINNPKMITGRQYRAFNGQIIRQGPF